ncbi:MAG: L-threonylcarbamoyladenylate synthase [Defluviitaleaceae bacterium]|nr:L-threonylcarbamoyladenylate synthase [Defluviitaleaceae bacterium]
MDTAKTVKMASGCEAVSEAAAIIASGGIAAFPTETVYGLGADAFNPTAVARVYAAKGRPGDNPLIMHIADSEVFFRLTEDPPPYARALIKAFWPGPLTLVAKKNRDLPLWVGGHPKGTAGTVGIRMPSHPLALALIKASGCIVAAPSANLAGTPSPTIAAHVAGDFAKGEIDYILDGGAVPGGLESTVVDVTGPAPVVLRPGAITVEMIANATGIKTHQPDMHTPSKEAPDSHLAVQENKTPPRSPGMKYRHYAPKAPMTLLIGNDSEIAAYIQGQCKQMYNQRMGILVTDETQAMLIQSLQHKHINYITLGPKASLETIAQNLYATLRQFDAIGVDVIFAEGFVQDGIGIAIMDRMTKAAEGRVTYV